MDVVCQSMFIKRQVFLLLKRFLPFYMQVENLAVALVIYAWRGVKKVKTESEKKNGDKNGDKNKA